MEIRKPLMFQRSGHSWTTDAEINFLQKLGSWVPDPLRNVSRKVLLEKYFRSMHHRVEWGSIQPEIIRKIVRAMIKDEKEK